MTRPRPWNAIFNQTMADWLNTHQGRAPAGPEAEEVSRMPLHARHGQRGLGEVLVLRGRIGNTVISSRPYDHTKDGL